MSKKMLRFTNVNKENPPKRGTSERKKDFHEIYNEFINFFNVTGSSASIHRAV